ncbi:MAG: amidohydrolase family protein [Candidatus Ranarchaeia archaeon]
MSILILGGFVVSMDERQKIYHPGAVYIEGNRISAVGNMEKLRGQYSSTASKIIEAPHHIILPGLMSLHVHSVASNVRGVGADTFLPAWLENVKWPYYTEMRPDEAYNAALLSDLEAIRSGVTTIVDHYYPCRKNEANSDAVLKAHKDSGIRAILVRGFMDRPSKAPEIFIQDKKSIWRDVERLVRSWNGSQDGRLGVWTGPDNVLFANKETIVALYKLAKKYDIGFHTHATESPGMAKAVKDLYGIGTIEMFHELGIHGPKFHAAHSVVLSEKEIKIMADTRMTAVNNIITNTYLVDGVSPVPKLLNAGVNVAWGTDATGTYGTQDIFLTMKFGSAIHKQWSGDPTVLNAQELVRIATVNGARGLDQTSELGTIEPGKKADLTIIDFNKPHLLPLHDIFATVGHLANAEDVDTVIVDGKIVMENRTFTCFDFNKVAEKVQQSANDLCNRAGIRRSIDSI